MRTIAVPERLVEAANNLVVAFHEEFSGQIHAMNMEIAELRDQLRSGFPALRDENIALAAETERMVQAVRDHYELMVKSPTRVTGADIDLYHAFGLDIAVFHQDEEEDDRVQHDGQAD